LRETEPTCWLLPRSTCHHWLFCHADDQRVPLLPSFARPGARLPSVEDADAGFPFARSVLGAGVDDEPIVQL
jgi:hypothetical protein